jgi:prepilin-type N-terminal cleavage/methylation domain-containing protein
MDRVKTNGFTLIETIIVLTIFALVLPAVFSIITAIVRQQADIYKLTEMKRQGDYALNLIKKVLREDIDKVYTKNGGSYTEICGQNGQHYDFFETTNNGNDFYMTKKNKSNKYVQFKLIQHTNISSLQYKDENNTTSTITNNNVSIPYFYINCFQKNEFYKTIISIQFAVIYRNKSNNQVKLNPLTYQTKIKLK